MNPGDAGTGLCTYPSERAEPDSTASPLCAANTHFLSARAELTVELLSLKVCLNKTKEHKGEHANHNQSRHHSGSVHRAWTK